MNQVLQSLIKVEKTIQIVALVGVILFLGYLGINSLQTDQNPKISPTTEVQ